MIRVELALRPAIFFGLLLLASEAFSQQSSAPAALFSSDKVIHSPLTEFKAGEILSVTAVVSGEPDWVRFFYRPEGLDSFQVRNMEKTGLDSFRYLFDTSQLVTPKFEYYLAARVGEEIFTFPQTGPENPLAVAGIEAPPAPAKFRLPFSVAVDGSLLDRAGESLTAAGQPAASGDGNFRLFRDYRRQGLEIGVNANLAYSSHPLPGVSDITLSNLALSLKTPHHSFQGGDIFLTHSPLTVSGLGRRGAAYQFQAAGFSFQVFDVGSQQASGWGGLLPRARANLYGGAAGFSLWGGRLGFKVVYVAGRDDPTLATNVAGGTLPQRKGAVLSFIPEAQMFNGALKLRAEYSRSVCDRNLADETGYDKDGAWQAEGSLTLGRVSLAGRYKHIGSRFASVGMQYLANDRQGFDGSFLLQGKKVQLMVNVLQEEDNVRREAGRSLSTDLNGQAMVFWTALPWLSINAGYRRDWQKIYSGPDKAKLADKWSTQDTFLGMGLALGPSLTLQMQAAWTRLRSDFDPLRNQEALVMNVGGTYRRGSTLSLASNLGFSVFGRSLKNRDVENFSAFLSGELPLWPGTLSLTALGSFNRTRTGPENIDNLNATALINFHLRTISRHLESALISLGGEVRRMSSAYYSDHSEWLKLQLHFSF